MPKFDRWMAIVLLIGILVGFKAVIPWDIEAAGHDAPAHFYKVKLLSEQITNVSDPLLWGSWDWNWYNGYPFLRAYPPLFYFISALLSLALNISVATSMKLVLFLLYPLTAMAAYLLAYQVSQDKLASVIGASVYVSLPSLITTITVTGRLPNTPVFLFSPLLLLFLDRLLEKKGRSSLNFAIATVLVPILILSHPYSLFLAPYVILLPIVRRLTHEKPDIKSYIFLPIGILLSLFWLLPFLQYTLVFTGIHQPPPWSASIPTLLERITRLLSWKGLGPLTFCFYILAIIVYFKERDRRFLPYLTCSTIALILFFVPFGLPGVIAPILTLLFGRIFPLETFTPIIVSYSVSKISGFSTFKMLILGAKRNREIFKFEIDAKGMGALLTISLILVQLYNVPVIHRNISQYEQDINAGKMIKELAKTQRLMLFSDGFEDLSNWSQIGGSWIAKGWAEVEMYNGTAYLLADEEYENFTYEVGFKWSGSKTVRIGIVFRYVDENNFYQVRWCGPWEVVKLEKKMDGEWYCFEPAPTGIKYHIEPDMWHEMKVKVQGNVIEVFIDGKHLFTSIDEKPIQRGKIGLTVAYGHGFFDDLVISTRIQREEVGWFRIWLLPRHPIIGLVSLESKASTIDGWYDEGSPAEIQYFIHRMIETDTDILNNTDAVIRVLRIFNVRFIIFNSHRFWPPFSKNNLIILENLKDSELLELVHEEDGIYIFELKETYPLMASTNAFVITKGDELATFYDIVSNESFKPSLGIFLSQENSDLENIPWKEWDGNFHHNGSVKLTINEIEAHEMCLKFDITVDRGCFVSLPISPFPCLKVEVDGSEVRFFKGLPAFIVVQLPAGRHVITVSPTLTTFEKHSITVSVVSFIFLIVYTVFDARREKLMRERG